MTKHNAEAEEGAAPGGRTSRRRSLLRLAECSRPGLILRLTRQEDVSCRDDRALNLPTLDLSIPAPAHTPSLSRDLPRCSGSCDSPLEGTGFEPSVPPRKRRPSRERPRGRPSSSRET